MNNIKWLFFDVGSTLIDESLCCENRLKYLAQTANVTYEYVYNSAMEFYKQNKKGDLEMFRLLNVEKQNGIIMTNAYTPIQKMF